MNLTAVSRYYPKFGVITKSNKCKTNALFEWLLCAKLQVVNVPTHMVVPIQIPLGLKSNERNISMVFTYSVLNLPLPPAFVVTLFTKNSHLATFLERQLIALSGIEVKFSNSNYLTERPF